MRFAFMAFMDIIQVVIVMISGVLFRPVDSAVIAEPHSGHHGCVAHFPG